MGPNLLLLYLSSINYYISSTSPTSPMTDATYGPVEIYPTLPPPPPTHHPQYVYATPHPSHVASYPSPGSNFSHIYPPHPSASAAAAAGPPTQLLQVSPWGLLSTPDDYEAYLAGAMHHHHNQDPYNY